MHLAPKLTSSSKRHSLSKKRRAAPAKKGADLRYWSKKFVAVAWAACGCMAVFGWPPGARNSYTSIKTAFVGLPRSLPCSPVPNPNAAADAAKFGTNPTGSMNFDFDTTGWPAVSWYHRESGPASQRFYVVQSAVSSASGIWSVPFLVQGRLG